MPAYVGIINKILSLGIIFLQILIILISVNLIWFRHLDNKFLLFFKKYTFLFGFLVALGAVASSLFYSEIVGFPPCELCWVQRIFLYPQLVLFGMELYKRDRSIVDFSIAFATLGSIVSIYHIYIENGGSSSLGCAALTPSNADGVSCVIRYIYEFGYITLPIMALTLSLFIITLLLNYKYVSRMK
ncbi:MAG TPA: disulfide bond formation protein B [Candidatus Paceibacterota bacterium]|nr:disulfide bond formation protein B [Candidatus Paceibacterota bacterium]